MPAGRLFLIVGLSTVALTAGILVPALVWVALGVDALALGAFLLDLRRAGRAVVTAERQLPTMLVQGTEDTLRVTLRNGMDRPLQVQLREGLAPELAAAPERTALTLPPAGTAEWSYPLEPRRRGQILAAPLTARILGPWGLAWAQRDLLPATPVRVYPQVRWGGKVGQLLALARRRELGQSPLRRQGAGSELYAVREYLPGDPLSRIHWKAAARHGRLVSREDTWEQGARLVVLLDCGRSMAAMDGQRSKLDHALAASLALTRLALGRGDKVTVVTFADQVERTVRLGSGAGAAQRVYGQLFDQQARLVEPAFDAAAETVLELERRRATVVLFTSVVDLAAAELLRRSLLSLERRHRPMLVNLEDPELVRLALGAPADEAEAFAKVAAMEIMLANRRLGRELRRSGVRAVTAAADQLALEALEGYLAIFRDARAA
jgi:uncharacterized protein (DUF58 family)